MKFKKNKKLVLLVNYYYDDDDDDGMSSTHYYNNRNKNVYKPSSINIHLMRGVGGVEGGEKGERGSYAVVVWVALELWQTNKRKIIFKLKV